MNRSIAPSGDSIFGFTLPLGTLTAMADAFSVPKALGQSSSGFRLCRLSPPALPARTLRRSSRYMPRIRACRVACAGVPAGSGSHIADSLVIHHSYLQFPPNRILAWKRPRNLSEAFKNANPGVVSIRSPTGTIAQTCDYSQPHSSRPPRRWPSVLDKTP